MLSQLKNCTTSNQQIGVYFSCVNKCPKSGRKKQKGMNRSLNTGYINTGCSLTQIDTFEAGIKLQITKYNRIQFLTLVDFMEFCSRKSCCTQRRYDKGENSLHYVVTLFGTHFELLQKCVLPKACTCGG